LSVDGPPKINFPHPGSPRTPRREPLAYAKKLKSSGNATIVPKVFPPHYTPGRSTKRLKTTELNSSINNT